MHFYYLMAFSAVSMCVAHNILAILPHQMKSHFDVFEPLLKELSARGHELTVISHFPQQQQQQQQQQRQQEQERERQHRHRRYRDVSLNGTVDLLLNAVSLNHPSSRVEKYLSARLVTDFSQRVCARGLPSEAIRNFIAEQSRPFDLILAEFFASNCYLALVEKFPAPLIGLSSCALLPWTGQYFGNPDNPAYIPQVFLDYSDDMRFAQRVENTLLYLANWLLYEFMSVRPADACARKFISATLPPLEEFAMNASLLLTNTHFTLSRPRPFVPAVVEIGGIHLEGRTRRFCSAVRAAADGCCVARTLKINPIANFHKFTSSNTAKIKLRAAHRWYE